MDNMITGILSAAVFIAFVAGLAHSIDELPFIIIVGIVCVMLLVDLTQSIRQGFSKTDRKRED